MIWLVVSMAGGLGAVARYLVDAVVTTRVRSTLPLGALVVNVTGSFVLGVLTGMALPDAPTWLRVAGTGFLGGYTTFSTAMVETARLAREHRWRAAWWHGVLNLGLSVVCAVLGLGLGAAFQG